MTELRPLERLHRAVTPRGWRVGVVSTARSVRRDHKGRVEALEVRYGSGRWDDREIAGCLPMLQGTTLDAAATRLLDALVDAGDVEEPEAAA